MGVEEPNAALRQSDSPVGLHQQARPWLAHPEHPQEGHHLALGLQDEALDARPHLERVDVLAQLALQEGAGVGPEDPHRVALEGIGPQLSHEEHSGPPR